MPHLNTDKARGKWVHLRGAAQLGWEAQAQKRRSEKTGGGRKREVRELEEECSVMFCYGMMAAWVRQDITVL